jgi:hypothetical protein
MTTENVARDALSNREASLQRMRELSTADGAQGNVPQPSGQRRGSRPSRRGVNTRRGSQRNHTSSHTVPAPGLSTSRVPAPGSSASHNQALAGPAAPSRAQFLAIIFPFIVRFTLEL